MPEQLELCWRNRLGTLEPGWIRALSRHRIDFSVVQIASLKRKKTEAFEK